MWFALRDATSDLILSGAVIVTLHIIIACHCLDKIISLKQWFSRNNKGKADDIEKNVFFFLQEYPFILDPFQKESLKCLENNQSVLVSAHTSAGKTVVAEYENISFIK